MIGSILPTSLPVRVAFGAVLGAVLATSVWAFSARPEPALKFVVNHTSGDMELFAAFDTQLVPALFDVEQSIYANSDGTVSYDDFYNGTWNIGNDIVSQLQVFQGASDVQMDAMSLMLHQRELTVPFETSVEATLSIGVCSTPELDRPPHVDQLRIFAGFYMDLPEETRDPLRIMFPKTGRETVWAQVKVFEDHRPVETYMARIDDGGDITIR